MRKTLLNLLCIMILALVSGCGREPCKRECNSDGKHCKRDCGSGGLECVDADDWGYAKIYVPADTETIVKEYGGSINRVEMDREVGSKREYAPNYEDYFKAKDAYITNHASKNGAVFGEYPDQHVRAINSGQIILGADNIPLVMTVGKSDQWTSWFSGVANDSPTMPDGDITAFDGGQSVRERECKYKVTNNSGPGRDEAPGMSVFGHIPGRNDGHFDLSPSVLWQSYNDSNSIFYLDADFNYRQVADENLLNQATPTDTNLGNDDNIVLKTNGYTPCYFRYGMGLYVGFAPSDDRGNVTDNDVIETFHIPDSKRPGIIADESVQTPSDNFQGRSLIDRAQSNVSAAHNLARGLDGYLARGLVSDEFPRVFTGDQLFFKIIDRYYNDNEGGYTVKLKEGARSPNSGPIEKIVDFFVDPVSEIMRRVYEGIVNNQDYINLVRTVLILYMVVYGYSFIIGRRSQEEYRKDAVIRIFKVAVITTLIGADSWDFFYNTVFSVFLSGVDGIGALLLNPFKHFDPQSPWYSMDSLLARLFSGETGAKISSTLFSNFPLGILFIIFMYVAMILFLIAVIKAIIVYIVGFISIAILIALAPVFFIFMLFEKTKGLTEEWFQSLVASAIQIIILMAALGMFGALIVMYMEQTIGYKVCWNVYARFDFIGVNQNMSPKFHLFDLKFWMPDIGTHMTNIWMDVDQNGFRDAGGAGRDPEMAFRYEDLPYLDPIHDREKVASYMTEKNFISFVDFLVFIVAVLLMLAFMDFVPQMAQALKGGSPKQTANIFGPAMGLHFTIMSGFKELGAKAWNIGRSQNTKNLMDEVLSYWDGEYQTRGMGAPRTMRKDSIADSTGALGSSERLRKTGLIQDSMIGGHRDYLKDDRKDLMEDARMKAILRGLGDESTVESMARRSQNKDQRSMVDFMISDSQKDKSESLVEGMIANTDQGARSFLEKSMDSSGRRGDSSMMQRGWIGQGGDSLVDKIIRESQNSGVLSLLEEAMKNAKQATGESLLSRAILDAKNNNKLSLLEEALQNAKQATGESLLSKAIRDAQKAGGGENLLEKALRDAQNVGGLSMLEKAMRDAQKGGGGENLLEKALREAQQKGGLSLLEKSMRDARKGGDGENLLEKAMREAKNGGDLSLLEKAMRDAQKGGGENLLQKALRDAQQKGGMSLLEKSLRDGQKSGGASLLEKAMLSAMKDSKGRNLLQDALAKGDQGKGESLLEAAMRNASATSGGRNLLESAIKKAAASGGDKSMMERFSGKAGGGANLLEAALNDKSLQGGGGSLLEQALKNASSTEQGRNLLQSAIEKAGRDGGKGSLLERAMANASSTKEGKNLLDSAIKKAATNNGSRTIMERFAAKKDGGANLLEAAMKDPASKGAEGSLLSRSLKQLNSTKEGKNLLQSALQEASNKGGGAGTIADALKIIEGKKEGKSLLDSAITKARSQDGGDKETMADTKGKFNLLASALNESAKGKAGGTSLMEKSLKEALNSDEGQSLMEKAMKNAVTDGKEGRTFDKFMGYVGQDGKASAVLGAAILETASKSNDRDIYSKFAVKAIEASRYTRNPIAFAAYGTNASKPVKEAILSDLKTNAQRLKEKQSAGEQIEHKDKAIIEAARVLSQIGASSGGLDRNKLTDQDKREIMSFVESEYYNPSDLPADVMAIFAGALGDRQKAKAGISYSLDSGGNDNNKKQDKEPNDWLGNTVESRMKQDEKNKREAEAKSASKKKEGSEYNRWGSEDIGGGGSYLDSQAEQSRKREEARRKRESEREKERLARQKKADSDKKKPESE